MPVKEKFTSLATFIRALRVNPLTVHLSLIHRSHTFLSVNQDFSKLVIALQ